MANYYRVKYKVLNILDCLLFDSPIGTQRNVFQRGNFLFWSQKVRQAKKSQDNSQANKKAIN